MLDKILVPLDGSTLAEMALPYAAQIAIAANSKEIVLLNVTEEGDERQANVEQGYLQSQISRLKDIWHELDIKAPKTSTLVVDTESGHTPSEILKSAERNDIELIVMSSHGRSGISRWLMGSVAEKVTRAANIPVLLIRSSVKRPSDQPAIKHILVPMDGSHIAEQALPFAIEIAIGASARVTLLHVGQILEPGPLATRKINEAKAYLDSISSKLAEKKISSTVTFRVGNPAEEILQEAQNADLLVMSSHGRTGLAKIAFGSVAWQVLTSSQAPVLMIKAGLKGDVPKHS